MKSLLQFEDVLISRWEDAEKRKLLNYDLNYMYKLLEGDFNFSVQVCYHTFFSQSLNFCRCEIMCESVQWKLQISSEKTDIMRCLHFRSHIDQKNLHDNCYVFFFT